MAASHVCGERRRACAAIEAVDLVGCGAIGDDDVQVRCKAQPMSIGSWWRGAFPTDAEVRTEIWMLGTRHRGWPLDGALEELKAANLTPARTQLLRACVRDLERR